MNKELISQRDCSTTILQVLFFLSGASSLIFETIFTRLLTYTFGNTAYAVSTVLASFLGGLALGAFVLGRWLDRHAPSLRFYGGLELLIGVYCLFIPSLFGWLTESYVALYYRLQLGTAGLTTLRVGLSSILILVPSFLMGGTLPAIARFLAARRSDFQSELDRFYALNTLGAASGVLISTYALIPVLGIRGTIVIASSINILIAIASNIRALSQGVVFSKSEEQESRASLQQPTATMPRVVSGILLLSSFLTGAVALGYEVVWTHVLGFLVGNTVYAFGLMLFTVLAGLGLGAHIAANHLSSPSRWLPGLTGSQVALGLTVFISLPLWPLIPALFAQGVSGAYNRDLLAMGVLVMARITYVFLRNRRENRTRALPRYRTYEAHILGITFAVFAAGVMPFLLEVWDDFLFGWRTAPIPLCFRPANRTRDLDGLELPASVESLQPRLAPGWAKDRQYLCCQHGRNRTGIACRRLSSSPSPWFGSCIPKRRNDQRSARSGVCPCAVTTKSVPQMALAGGCGLARIAVIRTLSWLGHSQGNRHLRVFRPGLARPANCVRQRGHPGRAYLSGADRFHTHTALEWEISGG